MGEIPFSSLREYVPGCTEQEVHRVCKRLMKKGIADLVEKSGKHFLVYKEQ